MQAYRKAECLGYNAATRISISLERFATCVFAKVFASDHEISPANPHFTVIFSAVHLFATIVQAKARSGTHPNFILVM